MELWGWIHEERAALLATFETLTPDQWEQPSLCGHWTVRQVLGHLVVAAKPPAGRFALEVAKALGSFDKANDKLAVETAAAPVDELIERYRGVLGGRFTPPGAGPRAPLSDILLHSLDVRLPLGLPSDVAPERYAPCLELLFDRARGRIFVPAKRPTVTWMATDQPWSYGTGAVVRGTMADLALTASGRPLHLDRLEGPGQPDVARWLAP
jgi:uncharacterized protein (TIGR03083 family)